MIAPHLDGVTVENGLDSAIVRLPAVDRARDYRVFALPAGATAAVGADGREHVTGTTVFCAGIRQRNAARPAQDEVVLAVEVAGLAGSTELVVEAIDRPCPFPGVLGRTHARIAVQNSEVDAAASAPFALYTETELRERYGSLIVNGQGPGATVGQPADASDPVVLAKATVTAAPLGNTAAPAMTFFESFGDPADQPAFVSTVLDYGRSQQGKLLQSRSLSVYTYGADAAQAFVDRGQLHMVLADWQQDIFASLFAVPRQPAHLDAEKYLRVTFSVSSNATARRYWWLSLCGAAQAGATIDADGKLMGSLIQTPFFYQDDGRNPSIEGWNCLQIFPRDGWPFGLAPDGQRPESDLRVMVNKAGPDARDSVVNVSPDQYGNPNIAAPSWFRQQRGTQLLAPMIDEQMRLSPNSRVDVYVRRDRAVVYVDGRQRLCNDFPTVPLTMAEAAVGFGQVLYHSAAERMELTESFNDRSGQRHYLTNTPFVDERRWDDLGFDERVAAPAGFDETSCHVHR